MIAPAVLADARRWAASLRGRRVGFVLAADYLGIYAHAGFLRAVEDELGLVPAAIAGSSAGALVGGLRAAGLAPATIEARLLRLRRDELWERGAALRLLGALPRGLARWSGYLEGRSLRRLLVEALPVERIEDCPIPLYVVSTNLRRRGRHLFARGELARALHASCAYPLLFGAVPVEGELHIDGGLVDPVPVDELVEREKIDAIVVHWPGEAGNGDADEARRRLAPWHLLRRGVDALRREHAALALRWARARGAETFVFRTRPRRVRLGRLEEDGPLALEQARWETLEIAAAFARPRRLSGETAPGALTPCPASSERSGSASGSSRG